MSDLSQESLLREIDEDLRRERYAKLWKQYGNQLIAALILVLAVVIGYMIWQDRAESRRADASERLAEAMQLANKDKEAAESKLRAIASDAPPGYAMLAAFRQAALLANADRDQNAARAAYQDLQRSLTDPIYRDLAVLLETMVVLHQETVPIDADAIRGKLQSLTLNTNAWRFSAREFLALLALKSGQTAEAKDQLGALAADPQTPAAMRERAQQIMAQVG